MQNIRWKPSKSFNVSPPAPIKIITRDRTGATLSGAIMSETTTMKTWFVGTFLEDHILPAMMMMAEQLTAVSMKQTEIIGTFLDAKHQMETQQVFQRLAARAHKDYHP